MKVLFLIIGTLFLTSTSCNKTWGTVKISNPTGSEVKNMAIKLSEPSLLKQISDFSGNFSVQSGGENLPFQLITENDKPVAILVLASLKAGEEKSIEILPAGKPADFRPMTQAEISVKEGGEWVWVTKENGNQQWEYKGGTWKNVKEFTVPEQHTDHSFDIRYEGPGWESDKIGYRFYLDWRNANDIFGKKVDTLVLQNVGLDGFDSYHLMSAWGVDNMKVGNSLGIGSIGYWADGKASRVEKADSRFSKIDYSGNLESKITSVYKGWETKEGKTDLTSELSIRAGSYLTKNDLTLSVPLANLCTGIIKMDSTEVIQCANAESEWSYFATFGVQSLEKDHLGLVIFYKKSDLLEITSDKLNHVIVLKPNGNNLTWYFGANWEQDQSGVKTSKEFKKFIEEQVELLNKGMI